ncbi:hypothetical protein BDN70DRAFT_783752, partial [Pholiota conissans]
MTKFIEILLGYVEEGTPTDGGVLGYVNAYYGCVEAQGRGSLHCHMLVWMDGALNSEQIKTRASSDPTFSERLIRYLDTEISNVVPPAVPGVNVLSGNFHPCSLRGLNGKNDFDSHVSAIQTDLHYLVESCQRHKHAATCYKHWKGPKERRECRFNLGDHISQDNTTFDADSGDLLLRHIDGLVNNFNESILRALRCNMDIQFLGSGPSTKAVIYYITDYITKSELKAQVAYAALELAIVKLLAQTFDDNSIQSQAKRMLQKCAFSMISTQELSAQQVISHLLDFQNHFTSHAYEKLYWGIIDHYVHKNDPLAESVTKDLHEDGTGNTDIIESEWEDEDIVDTIEDLDNVLTNDEEIGVRVEVNGSIGRQPTQLQSYFARGTQLKDMCL